MITFVLLIRLCISDEPGWLQIFNQRLMAKNAKRQEKVGLKKRQTLIKEHQFLEEDDNVASALAGGSQGVGEYDS